MNQPRLPVWATTANYPAGTESWAATARRVAPSDAEQAAGFVPDTQVEAQLLNSMLGVSLEALSGLFDLWAFNFPSVFNTNAFVPLNVDRSIAQQSLALTRGQLVVLTNSSGTVEYSNDGRTWRDGATPLAGAATILAGGDPRIQYDGATIIAIDGTSNTTAYSADLESAWTPGGNLPSSASWHRAQRWPVPGARWIAAGTNKLATAANDTLGTWTSRTVQHANGYNRIITAPKGSTPSDALLLSSASTTDITVLDSAYATALKTVAAGAVTFSDGCWSPYWGRWYLVDTTGGLYYAATATGAWTTVAGLTYPRIGAFGRALITYGVNDLNFPNIAVSLDGGTTWKRFAVWAGSTDSFAPAAWNYYTPLNGAPCLLRAEPDTTTTTAVGLRSPFEVLES
jgi:hypothetical protein